MAKNRPGKKPSTQRAIDARRMELRGGRSIRQVSRDQFELDASLTGEDIVPGTIRNRKSWAKNPESKVNRMIRKAPASVEAPSEVTGA